MDNESKKYLKSIIKMRPSFEIFSKLVQILKDEQKRSDQLLTIADISLLEASINKN
jgi:hypothetical protein